MQEGHLPDDLRGLSVNAKEKYLRLLGEYLLKEDPVDTTELDALWSDLSEQEKEEVDRVLHEMPRL